MCDFVRSGRIAELLKYMTVAECHVARAKFCDTCKPHVAWDAQPTKHEYFRMQSEAVNLRTRNISLGKAKPVEGILILRPAICA